ncbi:hypothetical protein Hanom_Chr16g01485341 [Helianthus anomalus]
MLVNFFELNVWLVPVGCKFYRLGCCGFEITQLVLMVVKIKHGWSLVWMPVKFLS